MFIHWHKFFSFLQVVYSTAFGETYVMDSKTFNRKHAPHVVSFQNFLGVASLNTVDRLFSLDFFERLRTLI